MFRISITYPSTSGAPFNWDYYMNNHLPLAVGTSMRHSGLNFCDADKPVNDNTPHACVCMVHFDSKETMVDFCNFFVKGHPESEPINNDEKNYTTIAPHMTAGDCEKIELAGGESTVGWRAKFFFPNFDSTDLSREKISAALTKMLHEQGAVEAGVLAVELDYCTSGIEPGSVPEYSLIWTIGFANRDRAEQFSEKLNSADNLQYLKELMQVEPQLMISEVMAFDLALTEAYR